MTDINVGSVAGMNDVDKLAAETAKDTQANIDALYAAQVAIEANAGNGTGDAVVNVKLGAADGANDPANDATKLHAELTKAGYNFDVDTIELGLNIMDEAGIRYTDGLDEAEKGLLNKCLTEMTNDGKINEAMAKKVQELGDFMAQQLSRG